MSPSHFVFKLIYAMQEEHGHPFVWTSNDIGMLMANAAIFEHNNFKLGNELIDALVQGDDEYPLIAELAERVPAHFKLVNAKLDDIYEQYKSPLQVATPQA